jgi:hypothetical protein
MPPLTAIGFDLSLRLPPVLAGIIARQKTRHINALPAEKSNNLAAKGLAFPGKRSVTK